MTAVVDRRSGRNSAAGFSLAALALYLFGRVLSWVAILCVLAPSHAGSATGSSSRSAGSRQWR